MAELLSSDVKNGVKTVMKTVVKKGVKINVQMREARSPTVQFTPFFTFFFTMLFTGRARPMAIALGLVLKRAHRISLSSAASRADRRQHRYEPCHKNDRDKGRYVGRRYTFQQPAHRTGEEERRDDARR